MTREEIESLTVGDTIEETYDTRNGEPLPNARWKARVVSKITFRGVSIKGDAYVGGYTQWADGLNVSFSVSEGEQRLRMCRHAEMATS